MSEDYDTRAEVEWAEWRSDEEISKLRAEIDALRELLRDIRPYVYGLDNIKRIDAAMERQP